MNFAGDFGPAAAFLIVWAGKATVLLGVAAAANLFLRRQSAALRHQVWAISIIGSLALPLASLALPAWHVISAPATAVVQAPATVSISMADADISVAPVQRHWDWGALVQAALALWAIGGAIFLLRLIAGLARLERTAAYSRVATADCLTAIAAELRGFFAIRRRIRVLESASETTMPMTWGVLRPRIVLPNGAAEWDGQRKRIVLSHEIAHVSRCDWALQVCAEVMRACFWFHPLAWISANRLRQESEHACDDAVLNSGVAAENYAGELLALTRASKTARREFSLALAIARPSNLERRFAAMLSPSTCRDGISRRRSLLTVALGACLLLPLAALTLSAEAPQPLPSASAATPAAAVAAVPQPESGSARAGNGAAASPRLIHAGSTASGVAAGWPAGRGRDAFLKDCSGCHAAEDVIGHEQGAKGWTNVLNEMTRFGAAIPKADFADVVDYLGTNFGVKSVSAVSSEGQPRAASSGSPLPRQTAAAPAPEAASASVSGLVEDASGAVIPGADVRLSQYNAATLEMYMVVRAGADGDFTFPSVVPATYELMVDVAGFKRYLQKDIQVQPGEHLNLHEIDLQVGTITQEVTVTASESAPTSGNEAEQAQQQPCVAPAVQAVPPLPPPPPGRIRIGGNVEQASIVCQGAPRYPAIAKAAHVQGTVVLHAIIGKDGSVTSLEFVSGPSLLTNAAMQAVKQWRYKPLVLDGQPVEVDSEVYVVFTLAK